ncbi:alpha/beta-hydrolase [Aspergillus pseudoustus]|uniref:Alpha/beta-hydrolase n=1 Tax=Aspergillus pseudoustus TaxID=1810923 RepID=A0ABR4JG28_9EURO
MATAVQITDGHFRFKDGSLAYQKTWTPTAPPIAKLVHLHGFSDHINNYYDLFPTLARQKILCTGFDQRGWGRSVHDRRERGNTGPTPLILEDIVCFIEAQLASPPAVPVFVMGHSMGGGLLATLASTPRYDGLVSQLGGIMLEAPYIDLVPTRRPWTITVTLGRALSRLFPHFQVRQNVPPHILVRDQEVQNAIRNDRFMYPIGTLEMLANMLERAANLSSGKLTLSNHVKALYVAHGTADQLTSYNATKHWFENQANTAQEREFKTYDGWSHLLHVDTPGNREIFIFANDCASWIRKMLKADLITAM